MIAQVLIKEIAIKEQEHALVREDLQVTTVLVRQLSTLLFSLYPGTSVLGYVRLTDLHS